MSISSNTWPLNQLLNFAASWVLYKANEHRESWVISHRVGQGYICSAHSYNLDLTSGLTGPHQIINYILWDLLHATLVEFKAYKYAANNFISNTNYWIVPGLTELLFYPHILTSTGTIKGYFKSAFNISQSDTETR